MSPQFFPPSMAPIGVRAVLVAAGNATRMGAVVGVRKPLIELGDRSILEHCASAFESCSAITSIVIVAHPQDVGQVREVVGRSQAFSKLCAVIPGGAERSDSVRLGCAADLPEPKQEEAPFDLVAIHDAARPFVHAEAITRCVEGARAHGAALLAMAVRDSLKKSNDGHFTNGSLDRSRLWAAQTPQIFEVNRLRECQSRALIENFQGTDDAELWERYLGPVQLIQGRWDNFKITEPADLALGTLLIQAAQDARSTP